MDKTEMFQGLKRDEWKEALSEQKGYLRDALISGWKADDKRIQQILKNHVLFLNEHGHKIDAKSFAAQTN